MRAVLGIGLAVLPIAVLAAGVWGFSRIRDGATSTAPGKPLNQRFFGYDATAAKEYWSKTDATKERLLLEVDLVFPLIYGAAFLTSLLVSRALLGRPFAVAWIVVPTAILILSDWIENTVHLRELSCFTRISSIDPSGWIAVASGATIVKLWLFVALLAVAGALGLWVAFSKASPHSGALRGLL